MAEERNLTLKCHGHLDELTFSISELQTIITNKSGTNTVPTPLHPNLQHIFSVVKGEANIFSVQ